jgi:hypothetical protein
VVEAVLATSSRLLASLEVVGEAVLTVHPATPQCPRWR